MVNSVNSKIIFTGTSWYISKIGTDSRDCGRDQQSACATFTQLLPHLMKDEAVLNYIWIDTDLYIMDMHLHNPGKALIFKNRASHVINITITNTTIEETGLWFEKNITTTITHTTIKQTKLNLNDNNIRITITNTTIEETKLGFQGNNNSVHIESSFIRSSSIWSSSPIVFRNCSFTDTKRYNIPSSQQTNNRIRLLRDEFSDNIIACDSSNITMMNVTVRDNEGCFMKIEGCNVKITNSEFRNNKGSDLFSVRGNITMMNVTVRDNEGHFLRAFRSHVQITDSDFRNNKQLELFSDKSKFILMNVEVRDNEGQFMEAKLCNVQITHSNFGNNRGLQFFSCNSNIIMMRVKVGENVGGFMETSGCDVQIQYSDFRNNSRSNLIRVYQSCNVHVTNSTFTGNKGQDHGTLVIESSHLTTIESQFLNNTSKGKGAAICVSDGTYNDQGSLFANNSAGEGNKL